MQHHAYSDEAALSIIDASVALEGPLLPILHALQEHFGFVGEAAIRLVAKALNLSRAEVHGVVSFYHDFRQEPAGERVLKLCRAEACQAMGARSVAGAVEAALGIGFGQTSADGRVTLEAVYCLGLCAAAPAALLDDRPIARLDAERAFRLAREMRA